MRWRTTLACLVALCSTGLRAGMNASERATLAPDLKSSSWPSTTSAPSLSLQTLGSATRCCVTRVTRRKQCLTRKEKRAGESAQNSAVSVQPGISACSALTEASSSARRISPEGAAELHDTRAVRGAALTRRGCRTAARTAPPLEASCRTASSRPPTA